ncbi:substrate-binding periplasmic protein [Roseateles sp.]|uniref:substrate-binding periplasmic protein n=1 Tax=Roseateles sp. TaxID=1971397 RepID=UPI0039604008
MQNLAADAPPSPALARRDWLRLGLTLALASASQALRAQTPARVLVYGDDAYAPVIYLQDGRPQGFLVDVLRRVEARNTNGITFDLELMPWSRAYLLASRGKGGLIGVSRNQERDALFDFSRPIYSDDIRVVVLKGKAFPFRDLPDLRGKRIGGVTGASYGERVDAAIRDGNLVIDRDIGAASRLRKLAAGHLDAALIGNGERGLEWLLAHDPRLAEYRDRFEILPTPLTHDPLHLAFLKSMQQRSFLDAFDAATKALALQV